VRAGHGGEVVLSPFIRQGCVLTHLPPCQRQHEYFFLTKCGRFVDKGRKTRMSSASYFPKILYRPIHMDILDWRLGVGLKRLRRPCRE